MSDELKQRLKKIHTDALDAYLSAVYKSTVYDRAYNLGFAHAIQQVLCVLGETQLLVDLSSETDRAIVQASKIEISND